MVYPVHVSNKKIEHCMNLLMTTDKKYISLCQIKYYNRFMCNKTKNEKKKKKKTLFQILLTMFY